MSAREAPPCPHESGLVPGDPGDFASLVLSCEHAGNQVPPAFDGCFTGAEEILAGHRGWDPGALAVALRLRDRFRAPLVATSVTRLLVDCNRREESPAVFSEFTRELPEAVREELLATWHRPHREAVRDAVVAASSRSRGRVLHVAVHSFTPVLDGALRQAEVGLLYDPARPGERALAARWRSRLRVQAPDLRVRRNYPYLGRADGLPTALRRVFPAEDYLGFELELNQALLLTRKGVERTATAMGRALRSLF